MFMSSLKDKITAVSAVIIVAIQMIVTSYPAKAVWKWCREHHGELFRYAIVMLVTVIVCISFMNKPASKGVEAAMIAPASYDSAEAVPQDTPSVNPKYQEEAEAIARVIYGIRDNSERDMRTHIWCILNRVDCQTGEFASVKTLEAAISKPSQWIFFETSYDYPVVESLYQIALEEVTTWHEGHRPCAPVFLYEKWSEDEIVLRSTWEYEYDTKTWRYGE